MKGASELIDIVGGEAIDPEIVQKGVSSQKDLCNVLRTYFIIDILHTQRIAIIGEHRTQRLNRPDTANLLAFGGTRVK